MTDQLELSTKRELRTVSKGVLNGTILTVASYITHPESNVPVKGLKIFPGAFVSGNHLPPGKIKTCNTIYDEDKGVYWFDIKVRKITAPTEFVFDAVGDVNGETVHLRFNVNINGESKVHLDNIHFEEDRLCYDLRAKTGQLLRYPLKAFAHRGLDTRELKPLDTKVKVNNGLRYAWQTDLENGVSQSFWIMGVAEIDNKEELYLVRLVTQLNDIVNYEVTQTAEDNIHVELELIEEPVGHLRLYGPVEYHFGKKDAEKPSVEGVVNSPDNFKVDGKKVSFDLSIAKIKVRGEIKIAFDLVDDREYSPPTNVIIAGDIKCWNNGAESVSAKIISHSYEKGIHKLSYEVIWDNDKPVENFTILSADHELNATIKNNVVTLSKKVDVDPNKKSVLSMVSYVDVSEYGIDHQFQFETELEVGSDVVPLKIGLSSATADGDKASYFVLINQNNGDKLKDIKLISVESNGATGTTIRSQSYDKDNFLLIFSLDLYKDKFPVVDPNLRLMVEATTDDDEVITQLLSVDSEISIPYKVSITPKDHFYTKSGDKTYLHVPYNVETNNPEEVHPKNINISHFLVNGKDVGHTKSYNQGLGELMFVVPVDENHGSILTFEGYGSVSGLSFFITLPNRTITYKTPGSATLTKKYTVNSGGRDKLVVEFDIHGWGAKAPRLIRIDGSQWKHQVGISGKNPETTYDCRTGKLILVFDIVESVENYSADNTIQMGRGDDTVYPISF